MKCGMQTEPGRRVGRIGGAGRLASGWISGLLAALVAAAGAPWAVASPIGLDRLFADAQVPQQLERAFASMLAAAIPDPKGEFVAFLAKTGFVIVRERGRPHLRMVENPDVPFLRRLTEFYDEPDSATRVLRLCRREEPERARQLGSYTVRRALETLERDQQEPALTEEGRRAIARAIIEELVATASIDPSNRIQATITDYLRAQGIPDRDVLAQGFALIEYDLPSRSEWKALARDGRLFCVRFSSQGFTVYYVAQGWEESRAYRTGSWARVVERSLASVARQSDPKPWVGFSIQ